MINILKLFSFFFLFFALTLKSFAIDAPSNFKVDKLAETSIELSWDEIEGAYMYYVYYSKKSGLETGYDNYIDVLDGSFIEILDLEPGTTYYFTVVAIDEEAEESQYSDELIINMTDSITKVFILDNINVISYNTIELAFSTPLNNSTNTIREFKIINKSDVLDSFEVISSSINEKDNSKLILVLDRDMKIGSEYEVVVTSITNFEGNNIESGIDSTETFILNEIKIEDIEIEKISIILDETVDDIKEDLVELNSADEKDMGPTGSNIDIKEVENTTLMLSKNNDKLPKTGPEHILIFILSIILGTLIFWFKYKKV